MTSLRRRALAATVAAACLLACDEDREGRDAVGTIEFTQTDVAPTVPARVQRILVEEGATVHAGDTLAVLVQTGLPQDIQQRRSRVAAAEAELNDLLRGARPEELERARAELRSATSEAERTAADSVRMARLLAAGGISQSAFDVASTAARVAGARRDATREALELLQAGARPDRIAVARAAAAAARAQLAMGEASASDLVLTAPTGGQVLARHAEPGEVLAAGIPVMSLGDARHAWVRVYVPAPIFASIKVGDMVPITVDGLEGEAFQGRVTALATAAEFTPRVALTEKERADLLFGVKLELSDSTGRLKAGLPATAHFRDAGRGTGNGGPATKGSATDRDP
jgi:HlyD family secretion protein